MPRRPNLDRPSKINLALPESLRTRLDLLLFSELEGCVPRGKYQEFFVERLTEYFAWKRLDTGHGVVTGPEEAIEYVKQALWEMYEPSKEPIE